MDEPRIETLLAEDLCETDQRRLDDLRRAVYPDTPPGGFEHPGSKPVPQIDWPEAMRPRLFLIRQGETIVATSRFLPRRIETAAGPMDVHALAGVKTHPDHRGRGLGAAVVRAALASVDDGTFPLSLFQTGVPDFYRKLHCREVGNRFVNRLGDDPQAKPWWEDHVMIYPADAPWPDGEVDLVGPAW